MNQTEHSHRQYPAAMVNITNRCTLSCKHCFIYRKGNPNDRLAEMDTETMLQKLAALQKRHGIQHMLWMGGEPLLRPAVLQKGVGLFAANTVTTNGTIDPIDLPECNYVISLDGPPEINDAVRGKGSFKKVMHTLARIPGQFRPKIICQCVVTRQNENALEELVDILRPSRADGMTFSFYVPPQNDTSDLTWGSLERRDKAVETVIGLKKKYPDFIWNKSRALELTKSQNAPAVTAHCPSKQLVLPLYLEDNEFVTPYCCHGNDVDCDLCGSWVVFHLAARLENQN